MARKKRESGVEIGDVVPAYDHASAVLAGRLAMAEAMAAKYGVDPPRISHLQMLLVDLPPFVTRESVSTVLGIPVAPKTMTNHDYLGTGPRLRFRVCGRVTYPTAFLLEWVEQQDLHPIASVASGRFSAL